jgi:4-hydroxybenzoate polyprenyltransferase
MIVKTYPAKSFRFWKAYFMQMRPYLLFVSGIAGVAGIAMSASGVTPTWKIVAAFVPFFLGYGFGQALTDCFQTDTDKISAPYRPLSQGIISIRSVLTVSITGLMTSGIILFLLHPISFWLCLLSVAGLATYSYVKKHYWFAGPFYNAWIVMLLPTMGYFTAMEVREANIPSYLFLSMAITFFSYTSFVLIGYLKDITADRETHYKTFPVVFGWKRTVQAGHVIALVTLVLFWYTYNMYGYNLIFGIAGSLVLINGQVQAHYSRQKDEKDALVPILSTVRSFILLHIAIVLYFQPQWWFAMLVFYGLFEIALYLRPSRYQV